MEREVYAIIMAAGSGSRMGLDLPKQFIEVDGVAVLERTIQKFRKACANINIVTVLNEEYIEFWKKYCEYHKFYEPQMIVKGGPSRFHSVKNALSKVPDGAIVAIHDGVRPHVSTKLIQNIITLVQNDNKAYIPIVPTIDSLRLFDKSEIYDSLTVGELLDRDKVFAIQTPQFFLSEDIKEAYNQPFDTLFTDDSSVALSHGISMNYTQGERWNIKITTKEDLELSSMFIKYSFLQDQ